MWQKFRSLFHSPTFEDEETTRLAGILNTVLWIMVAALLIFIILILIIVPEPWEAVRFFVVFLYPSFAALALMRYRRVQSAIIVFIMSLWVGIAITDLVTPSENGNLTSYMTILVMAGLLLKGRGALLLTVLTILVKLIAIPLNNLIAPELTEFAFAGVIGTATTLGIITALLHIASSSIDNALARARRNERQLSEKVDELRSLSDKLATARDEALAASKAKSEFLANMSHEIRTPLNAVVGMTELILDTSLDEQQLDFAETIRKSSDALLTLINDILDFSKIEANRLELELNTFDLRQCIESALDIVAPKSGSKELDIAYLIEPDTPGALLGDITRLRQVLVNLIGNGIKFTEKGEVVVTVSAKKTEPPKNGGQQNEQPWYEWQFSIRDTGIGISPADQERLFESFTQLDASTTRRYGGTGLGLTISQRLVDLMGGRIWVESEVGVGSTFHFTLLAQEAEYTPPIYLEQNLPLLRNKRLLVVDDNATNRKIIQLQAQMWGMKVTTVASGASALTLLADDEPFDLAILDMSMPEMDGLMLAEHIRVYHDKQSLPLVMLTSIGLRDFDARLAHFAAFLVKPIKSAALLEIIAGIFSSDASSEHLVRSFTTQATSIVFDAEMGKRLPLHILLAEDNHFNQKMTLLMLERLGYNADVVVNGKEAISALHRQPYDVVLMDVQMPIMDGLTATRRIRRAFGKQEPYIIALTADVVENARERCLAAGMNDYMSKPVSVADLVLALQGAHEVRAKNGDSPRPVPTNQTKAPPTPPPDKPTLQHAFDPTAIARMRMMLGTQANDMLPVLVDDFHKDTAQLFAEMETAIAEEEPDTLKRAAHSLKSNSAHFGLTTLSEQARSLEMKARTGDLTDTESSLSKLQKTYEASRSIIDAYLAE